VNHRIVTSAVRLVLLAFVAGALAFAMVVRPPGTRAGDLPPTHRSFGEGTCATCHGR
jgi:cytochrome c553